MYFFWISGLLAKSLPLRRVGRRPLLVVSSLSLALSLAFSLPLSLSLALSLPPSLPPSLWRRFLSRRAAGWRAPGMVGGGTVSVDRKKALKVFLE